MSCMRMQLACLSAWVVLQVRNVLHAHEGFAGMAVQDTGGFFIAVLEKVAPTPPLEDPKLGHRCVVCECRSTPSAPTRAGRC
jgi:hypothetical protein